MLPGHGDPEWSPSVQDRCLSFAKRGYVVMLVEPFGQNERGDIASWNESHDAQSTAYLLPTGQGLLGCIMSDHRAELSYLLSRPDVDARRVAVTGVSMGGTHSVWFAAIDPRVTACVPDAVLAAYSPRDSAHHMGLCDLMIGAYKVADMEMLFSLIAPRPLMELIPGTQAPLTEEGWQKLSAGLISYEEAEKKYACDEAQLAELHRYSREVYRRLKVPDFYLNRIVPGPHDYTKEMREDAAGFLAWAWGRAGTEGQKIGRTEKVGSSESSRGSWSTVPEPPLHPIVNRVEAVAALNFWPDGKRPPEVLGPTAYIERETSRLIAQLPSPPADLRHWRRMQTKLRSDLRDVLGVPLDSPRAAVRETGRARAEHGTIHKLVVSPEAGIELPMLLFEPDDGVPSNGEVVVLLDPAGMTATACCEERARLTRAGAWVLCVDLRGMGETRYAGESGGYLGFHDYDIACQALKLGETLAGYWTTDLIAAIAAAKVECGKLRVIVHAERETGLIALLAASRSEAIDAVETKGLLASYFSPHGYGLPFAYSDENNNKGVRDRPLGGYGSMVPCIPRILEHADIAQLAALVAPRPLTIAEPRWASDQVLTKDEVDRGFTWTRQVYHLYKTDAELKTSAAP